MAAAPDFIIFDCDGVLIDSEMLSAGVLMEMMAEIGMAIDAATFRADFLGRSFSSAAVNVQKRFGRPLPETFQRDYLDRLMARMAARLMPMPGVRAVLDGLAAPFCLATSSSPERLMLSLRVTGLISYFQGRCFTASQVRNGKPAPDLCLLAARAMGAVPEKCVVIEDTEAGLRAATSAGMAAWLFTGGAHFAQGETVIAPDVPVDRTINDMSELGEALHNLGLCRPAPKR